MGVEDEQAATTMVPASKNPTIGSDRNPDGYYGAIASFWSKQIYIESRHAWAPRSCGIGFGSSSSRRVGRLRRRRCC